ncbi:MAG: CarD family transcriptional regulator [Lachnospiraceae bacterium]|nr:CarD family transcriptional regulator [Lachnospiraceae bacterium]
MFEKGAFVVHGSNGVCHVESVGPLSGMGAGDKVYYTLIPVYSNGGKVFSPVDNARVAIRALMTIDEAQALLERVDSIGELLIIDEKKREEVYKQSFYSGLSENLVRIIKTIRRRNTERMAQGKRPTASDERYLHMAEDCLFGELAISFGITRDEAREKYSPLFDLPPCDEKI